MPSRAEPLAAQSREEPDPYSFPAMTIRGVLLDAREVGRVLEIAGIRPGVKVLALDGDLGPLVVAFEDIGVVGPVHVGGDSLGVGLRYLLLGWPDVFEIDRVAFFVRAES